jgi:hypothetical protein
MNNIKITVILGNRATDKITFEVEDITNVTEIYNKIAERTGSEVMANKAVALIRDGDFTLEDE